MIALVAVGAYASVVALAVLFFRVATAAERREARR